jgi:peptide deformylase
MILPVVKYGHPVLRRRGARIEQITPSITQLIQDMLETMRAAEGVGLAAQQVGQALQLTVIDVRAAKDRPSNLELDGQPADPHSIMPLVLINPEIRPFGEPETGPEGCLSFPDIYADITRPGRVEVRALDAQGRPITFKAGGLLSRVVQHECDHLQGILFIDRMSSRALAQVRDAIEALHRATKVALEQAALHPK